MRCAYCTCVSIVSVPSTIIILRTGIGPHVTVNKSCHHVNGLLAARGKKNSELRGF